MTDDLRFKSSHPLAEGLNPSSLDVIKVYKNFTLKEVLWERKEKPELSAHDRYVLTGLHKKYLDWYIARDLDNRLFIYENKPCKSANMPFSMIVDRWMSRCGRGEMFTIYNEIFQNIKWEDDECYTIRELLGE
jgi:hypothetical protein